MDLRTLKVLRFFHLINKKKYNEKRQIEIVKASPLFDAKWYLEQNPDVKAKKIGAAKHYVKWGWKEGRNPSKEFDTEAYLEQYPELLEKNWCPLFHYMLEHKELMQKAFNKTKEKKTKTGKVTECTDYKLIAKSKYFDKRWYLKTYPDVKKAGVDPVKHYLQFGWKEGRNPSKKFSTNDYLDLNADVKRAKINPLLHYEKYGKKEGRKFQNQKCSSVFYKLAQFIRTFKNKKIKKIVLFSHELTYTGAPLSLLKAAECLKELGYQIIIVSIKDGPLAAEFRKIGKVFISNNLNKSCLIVSFCDFAIINTITLYNEYNTLKNLIPTVWWIREPVRLLEDNNSMRISFMNADNIYTMSEFSRDEYLPYNSKVKIIKHGIKDYYHHVHIGNDKFIFTVIGTIGKRKGQDVFIDGIKLVNHKIKDKCEFHVLGLPYDKSFFSNLIKTSYDETNIKFLDPISDFDSMIRYYENISCVVVPSREEPTSRVALEAMMMGKPAIISDRVGARYVLKEGENGYTFPSENAQELASCIEKMADKIKKSAAQIEKSCREAYLKNNSLTVFKEALSNMIKETLLNYTKQKILVHLHLFYHDQLDWFLTKLKNITCPYDLFVTYVVENKESNSKLKQFKKDVNLVKVPNRGYDVAPFIHVLNSVNLDNYRYILKLHTKNFRSSYWCYNSIKYIKYQWRNALVNALIGSKEIFRKNLHDLKNEFIGMIGNENLISHRGAAANEEHRLAMCEKLGYDSKSDSYISGTMFICKSFLMKDIQHLNLTFDDFEATVTTGITGTLAHAMESILGHTVENYGLQIKGRKIFEWHVFLNKICNIWVGFKKRSKHNDEWYIQHSRYFNKKWYLKTYQDVKKTGMDPVKHYMQFGWKEGRNPGPKFDTNWYLKRYKDVKAAKVNPLVHYEKHGKYEGRNPYDIRHHKPFYLYPFIIRSRYLDYLESCRQQKENKINKKLPLIISLTTYPKRIYAVIETIESLLKQTKPVDKIILWLTYEEFPNKEKGLPEELLALKERGLIIDWCHNLRSYNKLLPALKKYPKAIHITVDDDIIYPDDLVEKLYENYLKHPRDIHCRRITQFYYDKGFKTHVGGEKYWSNGSFLNKLTGVGGVLYPPYCFYKDILDERLIQKLSPTNDDLWFWIQAVLKGIKIRVVETLDPKLDYVEGSQETGLYLINDRGENLFWKDFNNLIQHYTSLHNLFLSEYKKRTSLWNKISTYIFFPYYLLRYKQIKKIKKTKSVKKDMAYYQSLTPKQYPEELTEWYEKITHHKLNLKNPQTFNEKIQWLKLYDSTPLKTRLADKYLVRKWVEKRIGKQYLIPLLGVYDSFDEIDFAKLPNQFVIKCNHGSGWNIIVKDKSKLDLKEVKEKLDEWMSTNFAFLCGLELHYRDIKPKIIIEKYIQELGDALYDYRFFCSNGKVIQIWLDVYSGTPYHQRKIYDKNWNELNIIVKWPRLEKEVEKPKNLEKMIQLSETLSENFALVRVDFYDVNNHIYFGEMTFTSMSGTGKFNPETEDLKLGNMIKLPKLAYDMDKKKYYKLK